MGAGDDEVGVRDMPLAPIVRLVPPARNQSPRVGTESGSSHRIPGSVFCLAIPSVCEAPCSDGYCPVNNVALLGRHAVAPA